MRTPWAIEKIRELSYDYIKMDCDGGQCYGVIAVHRICFALALFHALLSASLVGVKDTRSPRSNIQNGWWGPKVLVWWILLAISWFIPNGFFIFWGNYISLIGATLFILIGLVLLVDFAHSWTELCLRNWEESETNLWQFILVGSTALMYSAAITLTGLLYAYFAGPTCVLNRFFISFNLVLCIAITILCVHPAVQDSNPRSGLAQSAMVAAYCTYLITSAVGNHTHKECNPLHQRAGFDKTTVIIGGLFTFVAIAYSTSRAATQSQVLVGKSKRTNAGPIALPDDSGLGLVNTQPSRTDTPRYQALLAAVEAGAIPASALDEEQSDEEDEGPQGEERDDERTGTRYNYAWFHIIFAMGAMYIAQLLTDWSIISSQPIPEEGDQPAHDIYIGRSTTAMWMRVISSWVCMILYSWSLLAPVVMPDRFGE
jgi:hypothetical protein